MKAVKGQTRTLFHFANERHGVQIIVDSDIMAWGVTHAAFLLDRVADHRIVDLPSSFSEDALTGDLFLSSGTRFSGWRWGRKVPLRR